MFDSNSVWIFLNVFLTSWLYSKSERAHFFSWNYLILSVWLEKVVKIRYDISTESIDTVCSSRASSMF